MVDVPPLPLPPSKFKAVANVSVTKVVPEDSFPITVINFFGKISEERRRRPTLQKNGEEEDDEDINDPS
eukprot:scaffold5932_cov68-Cylindrotheca_fusiformis.AAC.2